jgi:hypothetical protein
LFHVIRAISRVWVNFSRFKQSNLMVVAQGFDAQVCHEGKVPNAQCIAHSERFSCRLAHVLLFLERSIYSPPTGESRLLWPLDSSLTGCTILSSVPSTWMKASEKKTNSSEVSYLSPADVLLLSNIN